MSITLREFGQSDRIVRAQKEDFNLYKGIVLLFRL